MTHPHVDTLLYTHVHTFTFQILARDFNFYIFKCRMCKYRYFYVFSNCFYYYHFIIKFQIYWVTHAKHNNCAITFTNTVFAICKLKFPFVSFCPLVKWFVLCLQSSVFFAVKAAFMLWPPHATLGSFKNFLPPREDSATAVNTLWRPSDLFQLSNAHLKKL